MKYGYFDNDNREYVITRPDVPAPWTNYLGTEKFCTVISHNAGGYSFYHSPEYNRVTKFRPNFTQDRQGITSICAMMKLVISGQSLGSPLPKTSTTRSTKYATVCHTQNSVVITTVL